MTRVIIFAASVAAILFGAAQVQGDLYAGNGNTGFGGPLGTGNVALTDNGTSISGTFTRGAGNHNDYLVIYIDSVSGSAGFSTTSGFNDQADAHRRAISGVGSFGRSTVNFAAGFLADYAIAIFNNGGTFGGLWGLANGNDNSLNFVSSVNLSGGGNAAPSYSFDFDFSEIGITSGTPFKFVATYVAESGFRSNEAIGASDAPGSNIGSGTLNFSGFEVYPSAVPEPGAFLLCGAVGAFVASVAAKKRLSKRTADSAECGE